MAFLNENEWILLNEIAYNISFIYTKKAPVLFYGSFELKKAYDFRQMLFSLNIMTSYESILPYRFLMSIAFPNILKKIKVKTRDMELLPASTFNPSNSRSLGAGFFNK